MRCHLKMNNYKAAFPIRRFLHGDEFISGASSVLAELTKERCVAAVYRREELPSSSRDEM